MTPSSCAALQLKTLPYILESMAVCDFLGTVVSPLPVSVCWCEGVWVHVGVKMVVKVPLSYNDLQLTFNKWRNFEYSHREHVQQQYGYANCVQYNVYILYSVCGCVACCVQICCTVCVDMLHVVYKSIVQCVWMCCVLCTDLLYSVCGCVACSVQIYCTVCVDVLSTHSLCTVDMYTLCNFTVVTRYVVYNGKYTGMLT